MDSPASKGLRNQGERVITSYSLREVPLFVKVRHLDGLVLWRALAAGRASPAASAKKTGNATRPQECAGVSRMAVSGRIVSKTCTLIRVAEFDGDCGSFIRASGSG